MSAKPRDTEAYLARVPDDKRAALEKLRRQILAAAPGAVECIAWTMPSFRLEGKLLVCFGSAKNHVSLYPMSTVTMAAFADDLAEYDTSKGTIRFQPEKPLTATLVRRIVKARIAENKAKRAARGCAK